MIFASEGKVFDKYNKQLLWKSSDQNSWYEWWYFKVNDQKSGRSFYFVYGLVNPWDRNQTLISSKAFVQAGDFSQMKIIEEKFKPQDFKKTKNSILQIGKSNDFSEKHLRGDIVNESGHRVRWDLTVAHDWEFNAMGWTIRFPEISNIYWYPAQASTSMNGWIEFDGERTEILDGAGYQDRNWGRSFPDWWAWLVANNFKNSPGTVLAAGGGRPKILNKINIIDGFTIGLKHEGQEYSWRLPDLDKITLDIHFGRWIVSGKNRKGMKIEIEAFAPKEKFMILPFMTPQGKVFKDYETLSGNMTVRLYKKEAKTKEYKLVTTLETDQAGIEYGSFHEFALEKLFNTHLMLQ